MRKYNLSEQPTFNLLSLRESLVKIIRCVFVSIIASMNLSISLTKLSQVCKINQVTKLISCYLTCIKRYLIKDIDSMGKKLCIRSKSKCNLHSIQE